VSLRSKVRMDENFRGAKGDYGGAGNFRGAKGDYGTLRGAKVEIEAMPRTARSKLSLSRQLGKRAKPMRLRWRGRGTSITIVGDCGAEDERGTVMVPYACEFHAGRRLHRASKGPPFGIQPH
jgi:hypothetical protein